MYDWFDGILTTLYLQPYELKSLLDLPNEILIVIINYLKPEDQKNFITTCKRMRSLVPYANIWLYFNSSNFELIMNLPTDHIFYQIGNMNFEYVPCIHLDDVNNAHVNILLPISNFPMYNILDLSKFSNVKKIKLEGAVNGIFLSGESLSELICDGYYQYEKDKIIQMYPKIKFTFEKTPVVRSNHVGVTGSIGATYPHTADKLSYTNPQVTISDLMMIYGTAVVSAIIVEFVMHRIRT
jgi:hypothetical protein